MEKNMIGVPARIYRSFNLPTLRAAFVEIVDRYQTVTVSNIVIHGLKFQLVLSTDPEKLGECCAELEALLAR